MIDETKMKQFILETVKPLEQKFDQFVIEIKSDNSKFQEKLIADNSKFQEKILNEITLNQNIFEQRIENKLQLTIDNLDLKHQNFMEQIDRKFEMILDAIDPITKKNQLFEKQESTIQNHEMRLQNIETVIRSSQSN